MGKATKWIKNLLTGKKTSSQQPICVDAHQYPKTPFSDSLASSKDKRRWSFRKPSTTETYQHEPNVVDTTSYMKATQPTIEAENEQKRHALTVAAAAKTANAAEMSLTCSAPRIATSVEDTAVAAAAQVANKTVTRLSYSAPQIATSVEDTAATKIQSVFRSYLVCALH